MTIDSSRETVTAAERDRREPVARYVEFGDETIQAALIASAEKAFHGLVAADEFEGQSQIEVRTPAAATRRGLFRRSEPDYVAHVVPTTAALARVARSAGGLLRQIDESPNACSHSKRVARIMASVATDLVRDLCSLSPAEQAEHPAYRQTLRLTAELTALQEIVAELGCTNRDGCVGIRLPENWGRRLEDVEVAEVRAVLHQLDAAGHEDRLGYYHQD